MYNMSFMYSIDEYSLILKRHIPAINIYYIYTVNSYIDVKWYVHSNMYMFSNI